MIKVVLFDKEDSLQILRIIHDLSQYLIRNNMDLKMCHQHSDACSYCDIKDFCYECEEIEVWSINQCSKIDTKVE